MAFSAVEEDLLAEIIELLGGNIMSVPEIYPSKTQDLLAYIVTLLSGGGGSGTGSLSIEYRAGDYNGSQGNNKITFQKAGVNTPFSSADYVIMIQAYSALGKVDFEVTVQDAAYIEFTLLEDAYVIYQAFLKS